MKNLLTRVGFESETSENCFPVALPAELSCHRAVDHDTFIGKFDLPEVRILLMAMNFVILYSVIEIHKPCHNSFSNYKIALSA